MAARRRVRVLTSRERAQIEEHFLNNSRFTAEHTAATGLNLGNLNNAIHAVFRQANFSTGRTTIANADYAILEPSLRMATRLLQSDQIQPKLRTILLRGKTVYLREKCNKQSLYGYAQADCSTGPLTAKQRNSIADALAEMADHVTFYPHREGKGCHTVPHAAIKNSSVFAGRTSRVYYPASRFNKLRAATSATAAAQDTPFILFWRFWLAVNLVHELVHALQVAKEPRSRKTATDPFFHGEDVSEAGYSVERAALGGVLEGLYQDGTLKDGLRVHRLPNGDLSRLIGIPVWWEWECASTVEDMRAAGNHAIWVRKGWEKRKRAKDAAWRLYPEDMAAFFTNAFWRRGNNPAVSRFEDARRVGTLWTHEDGGSGPDGYPCQLNHVWTQRDRQLWKPEGFRKARGQPEMYRVPG